MALYNLSEFMTTVKEDCDIEDIPLPVSDERIKKHFIETTLKDFSILYPRVEKIRLGDANLTRKAKESMSTFYEYQIPKYVYEGTCVLSVAKLDVARPNGYSDFFIPNANWSTPDAIISAMADVRMSAGLASSLAKAPTYHFTDPDIIEVYNGWAGGIYEVELLLMHDPSLATVPAGTFTNLRKLAELDLKAFLYNKLKRKDGLDFGIGSFNLKIDDWSNAQQERQDLIKEWDEDANFNFDHIYRY